MAKRTIQNIALLLSTVILTILLTELFLRLFYPQNLNYTMFDENLMYRHIPNSEFKYSRQEYSNLIRFNSKGLRDYEYGYKKENVYRILILGDSFPEALQVQLNESFTKMLEDMLNKNNIRKDEYKNGYRKYEVINAGVGGYGTEQELIFLETEGIKYEPDAIILAYSLNDVEDNYFSPLIKVNNSLIIKSNVSAPIAKRFMLFCSRYLHLCSLAQTVLLQGVRENPLLRIILSKAKISSTGSSNIRFEPLDIYNKNRKEAFDKDLEDALLVISSMSDFAENHRMAFVVAIIPSREQVDRNKFMEFIKANSLNEGDLEINKIQRLLKQYFSLNNITSIDLLPHFKAKNVNNTFYFNIDGHWNKEGHKLAADMLYRERGKYVID